MSDVMWAAFFLNFSGAVGLTTIQLGRRRGSPLTRKLFWVVAIGGAIAFFLAMFLFIKDQGVRYGLIYWGVSGIAYSFITSFFLTGLMDGFRTILGMGALVAGGYFAFRAFL